MAKANVNTASREELVAAGVRAELVDEVLKLRRKGAVSLEALEAVQGVGPVTLEQLGQLLDFSDRSENGEGGDGRRVQESERGRDERAAAAPTAGTPAAGVRGAAVKAQELQQTEAKAAVQATRSGLLTVRRAAGTAGEVARRSADSSAELGQLMIDMVQEQTRHNADALAALATTVDWAGLCRIQADLLRTSLERMAELTRRQLELGQATMTALLDVGQEPDRKAAA